MSFEKYDWYEADGEIQKAYADSRDEAERRMNAVEGLLTELGAKNAYGRKSISGFSFDGPAPENWIIVRGIRNGETVYRPNLKTKERRALWEHIKAVKLPDDEIFSDQFGGRRVLGLNDASNAVRIAGPCFMRAGALCLFGVPKGYPEEHLGKDLTTLRPVPLSEIFAAKEKSGMEATA